MTICDPTERNRANSGATEGSPDQRTESIVQQLYATGLNLQMCLDGANSPAQRHRLEQAIDVLDGLITELGSRPLNHRSED
ncbi:MAG: hypothetical protein R2733_11155 [Acidimicrobiales bacterium]